MNVQFYYAYVYFYRRVCQDYALHTRIQAVFSYRFSVIVGTDCGKAGTCRSSLEARLSSGASSHETGRVGHR